MALERNVWGVSWGKQTARLSPASAPTKRGRPVSGSFNIQREDGQENASDGARFSNTATYTSTLQGGGTVGIQGQPGVVGSIIALQLGSDTATGTPANEVQVATVSGGPTGGSFRLVYTLGTQELTTEAIPLDSAAAIVVAALERVANIGTGNVGVVRSGSSPNYVYTITFQNTAGSAPHVLMTSTNTFTGGTAPTVTVTRTTAGVAKTHTIIPGVSSPYTTFWTKLGSSTVQLQKYNDCRISSAALQVGRDQMTARISPTVLSLDPGEITASDPVLSEEADTPMIWTEVEGTVTINNRQFRGAAGFTLTVSDELSPWYGDSARVHDMISGRGSVTLSDISILVNDAGLALYNEMYYGSPDPAVGSKPLVVPPAPGSFEANLWRYGTASDPGRQIKVTCPNVLWNPPESVSGDPEGGPPEVSFGGATRKVGANEHVTVVVRSADTASYVA